ncbi:DegT/DnrJ/EryC1/StrS family aminotransferase [Pseudanabaena sp. FACHB-1998]|uniref:DegT/DnrJ/EryC1/StrS family aminotransferase n=1 Tax=Pseudanabaena sp. FACHB-1998 TaxID=2692858 RepID=UPI001681AA0D|nr:DegT/DnrJ/EryC1/StrS family aminotransferase [Pseudanabaena sp. FACHB-1998]MBD2179053.1 DegT/DnrJ/EryC1/StrS family aminotransferase [Pseudanabaena sp. FACHB-1998]
MEATQTLVKPIQLPSDQDSSGRTLGEAELKLLAEAINSGTLTSTKGNFVKALENQFAEMLGVKYAYACSSGSGAIHTAIAAIDPEPGDEIITTSITDMGALTPILYQGAIPVFADVDPTTWNVTAESIKACLSDRTKAIIVTHLFGNPCNMTEIVELAASRNIPIIEDCAQSFLAEHNGKKVGAIGSIGCFSLQQGKHITTGEGGIVTTNDDAFARRMFLFINKAWGYGDPQPDHYFLALNGRMCELQGAVAVAQLSKLTEIVQSRQVAAEKLTAKLQGLDGIVTPTIDSRNTHVYWKYCLSVDSQKIADGAVGLAKNLKAKGIFSAPRYIQKPAFMCEIFQKQRTFGNSRFPFTLARPEAVDYATDRFTGTYSGLEAVLVLPWNERYTDEHINYIAEAILEAVEQLKK